MPPRASPAARVGQNSYTVARRAGAVQLTLDVGVELARSAAVGRPSRRPASRRRRVQGVAAPTSTAATASLARRGRGRERQEARDDATRSRSRPVRRRPGPATPADSVRRGGQAPATPTGAGPARTARDRVGTRSEPAGPDRTAYTVRPSTHQSGRRGLPPPRACEPCRQRPGHQQAVRAAAGAGNALPGGEQAAAGGGGRVGERGRRRRALRSTRARTSPSWPAASSAEEHEARRAVARRRVRHDEGDAVEPGPPPWCGARPR